VAQQHNQQPQQKQQVLTAWWEPPLHDADTWTVDSSNAATTRALAVPAVQGQRQVCTTRRVCCR
jgi:hypothetical protein